MIIGGDKGFGKTPKKKPSIFKKAVFIKRKKKNKTKDNYYANGRKKKVPIYKSW